METTSAVRVLTVTLSDTRSRHNDESGKALVASVIAAGHRHVRHILIKDEPEFLRELVRSAALSNECDAIVLTGGTGIGRRDQTFEALEAIFQKRIDGFGEAFRRLSWDEIGPRAILSRATAGVVDECVVYSLPGSVGAVELGMRELVLPTIVHAVDLASGRAANATNEHLALHASHPPPSGHAHAASLGTPIHGPHGAHTPPHGKGPGGSTK